MRLNLSQYSLPSDKLVLSSESPDALDTLKVKLRTEQQPANETEEILVNEMAEQFWRLRRARAIETSLLDSDQVLIPHLAAIQRMMSSAERGFHKALTVLRQLQKERGFVPQKHESGFVPANSPAVGRTVLPSADESGFVSQSDQNPDLACEGTPASARKGAVKLTAQRCELTAHAGFVPANSISEPRPRGSGATGFVPPPCPADEDIDPADWARAFAARHRVHAKVSS